MLPLQIYSLTSEIYNLKSEMASIDWLDWSEAAFRRAAAEQRPIVLAVVAAWSGECERMDRTSYSDPDVIQAINERFIPIRVDSDRRPDVNERYNLGGWPTTAFLTPDGRVLGGGTFVSADRLRTALNRVDEAFRLRGGAFDHDSESCPDTPDESAGPRLDAAAEEWLGDRLLEELDSGHEGAGGNRPPPNIAALELALDRYAKTGDERFAMLCSASLDAIGVGSYDAVEGGFFNLAAGSESAGLHNEKLLDQNARLLRLCLDAGERLHDVRYLARAADLVRFVHTILTDVLDGGFYQSQKSDVEYFDLDAEARRLRPAPPVDRRMFADANALMCMAFLRAGAVLDDPALRDLALQSLERVTLATYRPGGGIAHTVAGDPPVRGLLSDHVQMSAAFLEAEAVTGRDAYLDLAHELMRFALRTMWDDASGGFHDRASPPEGMAELGLLRVPVKPFLTNCEAARVLARLAAATGEPDLRTYAVAALASQTAVYRGRGLDGAPYGLALAEVAPLALPPGPTSLP